MKRKRTSVWAILVLLLLFITLGYALLSTNLNINGTTIFNSTSWDIHFENIQTKSGGVTPSSAATINAAGDTVSFTVTFNVPGEFYEFNVDARNAGTVDGVISSVVSKVNNQPISNLPAYLEYYVKYADGKEIQSNDLLIAGDVETYTVHIGYKSDISAGDLPSSNASYVITLGATYVQASSGATPRASNYKFTVDYATTIGSAIPNGLTTYNTFGAVMSGYGHPFFTRSIVQNGIVTDSYIGFVMNNKVYYIKGGDGGASYEANKAVVTSVFGTANCSENYFNYSGGYYTYNCANSSWTTYMDSNGHVQYGDGPHLCDLYPEGLAYCYDQ